MTLLSAAGSHVGKVRSNNQDSGYAGEHLFVVADGMGGHAGGDVASALAIQSIAHIDRAFENASDAAQALRSALLEANQELAETVFEHPELAGMGTTVSGLVRVGDRLALAHIGDSRVYRWRDGELTQVTKDHTFVQRLVDSGRITAEEAAVHPRRSVLMRVLGDVDLTPEIDIEVLDARPGDRWVLCSDGLSGYVTEQRVGELLDEHPDAAAAVEALIDESLDHGAPDNVTVVIVGIDDSGSSSIGAPVMVGSAAKPLSYTAAVSKRSVRLPSLLLHPLTATSVPADEHFEPESEEFLRELIAEDERRKVRRRITWSVGILLVAGLLVAALAAGYQWTQSRYFVGVSNGQVAIFQGVQQGIGPFPLSSVYFESDIDVDDLSPFSRQRVESTINADDLPEALSIIERLTAEVER
ncbi:PP2C family protein-serine/threonine phosphatase [Microcella humidisoli]|uniref:Protein phosphatase 2C domain-containing protein n=1 Tax=Microcella humidisoli TaxID=2963406 RepID=A0ABY5G0N1_9MICO|nr:PP2C family serine/threonine-protein phosphatase [Microcella humidisoli]UTT63516.1 protein phosphatase 2C domain-containing protein [Microcella humidisoli]